MARPALPWPARLPPHCATTWHQRPPSPAHPHGPWLRAAAQVSLRTIRDALGAAGGGGSSVREVHFVLFEDSAVDAWLGAATELGLPEAAQEEEGAEAEEEGAGGGEGEAQCGSGGGAGEECDAGPGSQR